MGEISLKGIFSLALVKKERFCGSHGNMRYMLCKAEEQLQASVYPEPYCWIKKNRSFLNCPTRESGRQWTGSMKNMRNTV